MSANDWKQVIQSLQAEGIGTLVLTEDQHSAAQAAFLATENVLSQANDLTPIADVLDAAHVTGYHKAGGLSHFNQYREGFVLSDGQTFSISDAFDGPVRNMQEILYSLAGSAVTAIENHLRLESNFVEDTMGPTRDHSQWHLKRYLAPSTGTEHEIGKPVHWLMSHTDPSLISVVVHFQPVGCRGLEYCRRKEGSATEKEWVHLDPGQPVAVFFVGSILSYVTGGYFPACKHRVNPPPGCAVANNKRMAATLFVRPRPDASLAVWRASPLLEAAPSRKQLTFGQWNARVSRHYASKGIASPKRVAADKKKEAQHDDFYFCDDTHEITLLDCNPPLHGREKYLGGELADNGMIYCIPGHARRVLKIDPLTDTVTAIGQSFVGDFKWLRSVKMPKTGIIIGIPCHADALLRIDPATDSVSTITWDETECACDTLWKWHGGNISPHDGCMYCIPQRAERVMRFDPTTETVSFVGPPLVGRNKWYGGLVAPCDGCIYGIPQNATGVLRIDAAAASVSVHGDFCEGAHKWHGGLVGPDGNIYGIPANADTILRVIPGSEPHVSTFGGPLRAGKHRTDGKYKYLGSAAGRDGKIYFFPSDCDYVLQVDPVTLESREVGPNLRDVEPIQQNKWQNGVKFRDGSIVGIPLKASSVLRIRVSDSGEEPQVACIGGPFDGLNLWEGGVQSQDGTLYCMPLNHSKVLKVRLLS